LQILQESTYRRGMNLEQLAAFVRIVETGSLTAAARATRQSLASVSRHLMALEEDLGVELARRTTRKLVVSGAGLELHQRALRILGDVEAARTTLRAGKLRGSLSISLPVTLGQHLVVPRLGPLLARHPGLSLEVRLEDRLNDLVAEGIDLVVRAGTPLPDSAAFIAAPLLRFRRVLVAAPSFAKAVAKSLRGPAGLSRLDCLVQVGATGPQRRWTLEEQGPTGPSRAQTVEVQGRLSSTAPLVLLQAALDGAGVAFLPDWLVAQHLEGRGLSRLLPRWSSGPLTAWAMYRQELRGSPAVRALLEAVAQA
jgi:DNA-binding transcriptional LysR family regulator